MKKIKRKLSTFNVLLVLLLISHVLLSCSQLDKLGIKYPWDKDAGKIEIEETDFFKENKPVKLIRSSQGYYLMEVLIEGGTYKFLLDTGISAVVLFKDKVDAMFYTDFEQSVKIKTLNGEVSGTNGRATLIFGDPTAMIAYGAGDMNVVITDSSSYRNESGSTYADADGVLGLRFKRSGQFLTSAETIDVPLDTITPKINLMELNLDPKGEASLGMGIAPFTSLAKEEYLFFTNIDGVLDAGDPVNKSFTDMEPDGQILNADGELVNTKILLSTSTKDKFILDETLAITLGYNRVSKSWAAATELTVFLKGKYSSLKMPLDFTPDDVKVEVLSGSSDTTGYATLNIADITATITDDDVDPVVAIKVDAAPNSINEDGSGTYTYTLDKAPNGMVKTDFSVAVGDIGKVKFSYDNCSTLLTFGTDFAEMIFTPVDPYIPDDPEYYDQPHSFSLCPVDDDPDATDETITLTLTVDAGVSDDTSGYKLLAPVNQTITINDDEKRSLNISRLTEIILSETASPEEVRIALSSEPDGDVAVDVTSSDSSEVLISLDDCATSAVSQTVIIDASTYEYGAAYSICPVNDNDDDGDIILNIAYAINGGLTTDTTGFATAPGVPNLDLKITDDDEVVVSFSETSFSIREQGSSSSVVVSLGSTPDGDVAIDFTTPDSALMLLSVTDDDCGTIASSYTLTFTAGDSYADKAIEFCPVDDLLDNGYPILSLTPTINGVFTGDGTGYAGLTFSPISVKVIDTDAPYIVQSTTTIAITEGGDAQSVEISLNSLSDDGAGNSVLEPDGDIVIDLVSPDTTEVLLSKNNCVSTEESLQISFDLNNYFLSETIYFCPQTDNSDDGDINFNLTPTINAELTTDTTGFAALLIDTFAITVSDIDSPASTTPGLVISEATPSMAENGSETIKVNLNSKPNGTVVVDALSKDKTKLLLALSDCDNAAETVNVSFNESNWGDAQSIELCAVDNSSEDGDANVNIGFSINISGKDTDFKAVLGLSAWQNYIVGFDITDYQSGGPSGTLFLLDRDESYETAEYYSYLPENNPNLVKLSGLNTIADEKYPDVSNDGKTIVFQSERPGDMGGLDIQVYKEGTGVIYMPEINSVSEDASPSISADGNLLVFHSNRADGEGSYDIYLYDLANYTFIDLPGLNTSALERSPDISSDGNFITFRSERSGLALPAGGGGSDIFVYDRSKQSLVELTSLNSSDAEYDPTISKNGKYVAFEGYLRYDGQGGFDAFMYDVEADQMMDFASNTNTVYREGAVSISPDAGFVAFDTTRNKPDIGNIGRDITLYDVEAAEVIFLPGLNSHFEDSAPNISDNAKYIVFHSKRPGSVGGFDVYLYKRN